MNLFMAQDKKTKDEYTSYLSIMKAALYKEDYDVYDAAKGMLEEAVDSNKHKARLAKELSTTNFGVLNHIFEEQLPSLLKTNKKAVKEVIKTIKGDSNLLNEFAFYNTVQNAYRNSSESTVDANRLLESLSSIATQRIDVDTVKKSNAKLRDVMVENGVIPSDFVEQDKRRLYEACDTLLTMKKTSANMLPIMESFDCICKYMDSKKEEPVQKHKTIDELTEEYEDSLRTNLNEDEVAFVKQITDFKTPIAEQRKERLFNKLKEDCISKVNELMSKGDEKQELAELKSKIEEIKFCNETVIKDVAKLLEIRDILNQ